MVDVDDTFIALLIGLTGQKGGFEAALAISLVQTIWFATSRGAAAIPTQIRYVYFVIIAIAYFDPTNLLCIVLAIGTAMVVLFGRCMIARVLVKAPWNAGVFPT